MSAERTHGETQFIQRNSAPQNCAPGIAHSSSTLVNVHQVYLMCQATGLDNFHLAFSYPVFESSCTGTYFREYSHRTCRVRSRSPLRPKQISELKSAEHGTVIFSACTSEWDGGGLTRGEGACPTSRVMPSVGRLVAFVALLPLASARICLFLQR